MCDLLFDDGDLLLECVVDPELQFRSGPVIGGSTAGEANV